MIARLVGWLDGFASSAILLREAARTSRRWQTYAARAGFSGALFGVLLLGIWSFMNAGIDPADMGWMGRGIFIAFSTVLMLMAITLAPLTSSAAMIEETQDRTLEMLILSDLTPDRILVGKVLSRILVLLTVVFGALPVLAMVVTLGGVAPHQVVAVVVHALVAIVVMGALGAFYGLFTRSPMLAMLASVAYGFVTFVLFPLGYTILTAKPEHAAHFSLFAGPGTKDWAALVAPLSYLPSLGVMLVIGTRLFDLQISNADIRQAFSAQTWGTRRVVMSFAALFVAGLVLVLPASFVLYTLRLAGATSTLASVGITAAAAVVWVWATGLLTVLTWILLRVGVDVVDALDAILGGRDKLQDRSRAIWVWANPVAWREARPAAWSTNGMPVLVTWLLLMLGLLQTGWWLIPGGALSMGVLNTLAAYGLTVWLAARSVDEERRGDSLVVMLTTTLPSTSIVLGKALGVAVITAPLLLLSLPFVGLGVPYLYVFEVFERADGATFADLTARGLFAWAWSVALWAVLLLGSLFVGLSVKRSRSGFTVAAGLLLVVLGLPTLVGRLFEDVIWLALPCRLVVPPLAGGAELWQYVVSIVGWSGVAVVLFATLSVGLRRWIIAALAALLTLGVSMDTAVAQSNIPVQDQMQVIAEPLGDGIVRPGHWAPVRVRVANLGPPAKARVRIEERSGGSTASYGRSIELPQGSRKDLLLLARPGTSHAPRKVVVETTLGRIAVAPVRWRHAGEEDATIGVFGRDLLGVQLLQNAFGGGIPGRTARVTVDERDVFAGLVEPGVLPRHGPAWEAFDQLVWPDADPGALEPDAQLALAHWVADGGHLVVGLSERSVTFQDSPLVELLPLRPVRTVDREAVGALERFGIDGVVPVVEGDARGLSDRSVYTYLTTDDGKPLWRTATYGLGTVTVLAFDPRRVRTQGERTALWREVLHLPTADQTLLEPTTAVHFDGEGRAAPIEDALVRLRRALHADAPLVDALGLVFAEQHHQEVRSWLSDIPGVAPLPIEWLLLFSGLYLFIIGPVDGFVLRWLRRQPWTWVTFPVTIVVFTTFALVGTSWVKGSEAVVTSLEVVDVLPGTELWRGLTHVGVFATQHTEIGLEGKTSDAVAWVRQDAGFADAVGVDAGFGAGNARWTAETWTLGYGAVRWTAPSRGTLRVERVDGELRVTNTLDVALTDVEVVLVADEPTVRVVGPLAPGETRTVVARTERFDEGESELAGLRRMFYREPAGDRGVLSMRDGLVVFALTEPLAPPAVHGVRPKHQRATLLRVPVPELSVRGDAP